MIIPQQFAIVNKSVGGTRQAAGNQSERTNMEGG
jgi:hypothetical protein